MRSGRCLILTLALAGPAAARDIYVDNVAGDDRAAGNQVQGRADMTGPVQTIAKALRLAGRGDRIILAKTDQPYRESISLVGNRHSGYSFQALVIAGNGAVLDGTAPVPADAWQHHQGAVFRFRPPQASYQQLFVNDRPGVRVIADSLAQHPPKLEPLEWCLHGGYLYFCVQPQKLPEDYRLSYAHRPVGITLCQVEEVAIQDLVVQGFQLDGIAAANGARKVRLARVTCQSNGRSGISVGGASQVEIDACLVGGNGMSQLLTLPWSRAHVRESKLLTNPAPAWVDQGGIVYVDGERVQGGLERIPPAAEGKAAPADGKK